MVIARRARDAAADQVPVLLRLVRIDDVDCVRAVGLGQIVLVVPDVFRRRGHELGLLLDTPVVGIVHHRDDGIRRIARLVVLRGLVLVIPRRRDARAVGITDDLLIAVGVKDVRRPAAGRLAVDDLVGRVVNRRRAGAPLVIQCPVASRIKNKRVAVWRRAAAVFAEQLVRFVVEPRRAAGVGFDNARAISGRIVAVSIAGNRRGARADICQLHELVSLIEREAGPRPVGQFLERPPRGAIIGITRAVPFRIHQAHDAFGGVKDVRKPPPGWRDEIFPLRDGVERIRQPLSGRQNDHGFSRQGVERVRIPARPVGHFNPISSRIIDQNIATIPLPIRAETRRELRTSLTALAVIRGNGERSFQFKMAIISDRELRDNFP